MNEAETYKITECFDIEGRGLVVALDRLVSELPIGCPLSACVTTPNGQRMTSVAYRELICRRRPLQPTDSDAFLLKDLRKDQIPAGSAITISKSNETGTDHNKSRTS